MVYDWENKPARLRRVLWLAALALAVALAWGVFALLSIAQG